MKTKPFDIEAAKNGAKVVTRSGMPVRILSFDYKGTDGCSIVGLTTDGDKEIITAWTKEGEMVSKHYSQIHGFLRVTPFFASDAESNYDLVMPFETVERYAIVGKSPVTGEFFTDGCLYESESRAQEALREVREAHNASFCTIVGVVKVEIEV